MVFIPHLLLTFYLYMAYIPYKFNLFGVKNMLYPIHSKPYRHEPVIRLRHIFFIAAIIAATWQLHSLSSALNSCEATLSEVKSNLEELSSAIYELQNQVYNTGAVCHD